MSTAQSELRADVARRVDSVRARIRSAGGDRRDVQLVAVTKGFGSEVVEAVLAAGVTDTAESYAQELVAKAAVVSGAHWHFVGRLQTNKVRQVAPFVHLWQSIDRPELADELSRRAAGARAMVQVNVCGEQGKGGCDPRDAPVLVDHLRRSGIDVVGLMAVGGFAASPERARPGFRLLNELADRLELAERSMGMSDDLEVAVEEGSTMVRVGRALFGPRPRPPAGHGAVQPPGVREPRLSRYL